MKLSKELEMEVMQVYLDYWDAYMKGDTNKNIDYIGESITMFGSTENEVFTDKQGAANFFTSTAGEVAGKVDFRNRNINIVPVDEMVLVIEQMDLYILSGNDWTFYAKSRLSSLFKHYSNGWKLIHQHGSFPDNMVQEGETIAFERMAKENQELKEAVKRRTIELEQKNRELEIEAALERIRARTMAMQKSNELAETSFLLFQQFKDLGATSEQISIGIFREEDNIMELYSTLYGFQWEKPARVDLDEPVVMKKILTAWKEQRKSLVIDISGNDLQRYNVYRKKLSNLEYKEDRWVIHIAFFSKGILTLSTTEPHSHATIALLERFAIMFDGTYTRFLDLQKAEAQAREAQIQLALERVRARTMAMHNSSELADTTGVLFQQFMNLGITPKRCLIGIMDKKNQSCEFFYTGFDGKVIPSPDLVPMNEQENLKQLYNAWLKNKDHLYFKLVGQQRVNWTTYIMNKAKMHFPEYKPDKINLKLISSLPAVFNTFFFTQGFIMLHTVDEIPEPEISMLKRFSGVFEQTYTRFLDLQKAEAQAREAQIEAALERVRARAMAMYKSEELAETAKVMF
ncbi:MAG TPA: nuclear transport factor 2 family protein, partial [Agriterribacter sp.]|nr:nuclear transport factor 2 family protein [Agriterribacter sp.]